MTDETLPEITAASPDVFCWLWAAVPPKNGRLHVARCAATVGVSQSTIRRWVRAGDTKKLDAPTQKLLLSRAYLRGHGDLLWPPLNDERALSASLQRESAERSLRKVHTGEGSIPEGWRENGTLSPYNVYLVYYPIPRVYAVTSGRTPTAASRVRQQKGDVLEVVTVPNKFAASVLKYDILDAVSDGRCLPPRSLVPKGRTEAWWQRIGSVSLQSFRDARDELIPR